MTKTAINDKNCPAPSIHERSLMRLGCVRPHYPAATFSYLRYRHAPACQSLTRSPLHRLRETLGERLQAGQQGLMVPAQALKLVGEIERRQNHQIDRINRLAAGTNCPNLLVDRRGEAARPVVAVIAGNDQIMPHDLDRDASHTSIRN